MVISFNKDKYWPQEKEWLLAHDGVSIECEDGEQEALIRLELPCRHLVRATEEAAAGCRIHENKPQICQEYPDADNLEYLKEHPWLTPRCSYVNEAVSQDQSEVPKTKLKKPSPTKI